jgi:hypothetical protein
MTQVQPEPEKTEERDNEEEPTLEHPTLFDQDDYSDAGS